MSTFVWCNRTGDVAADHTVIKQLKEDLSLERKLNSSLLEEFSAIKRERDMLKARNEHLMKINEELTENLEAVESRTRDNQVELFRKLEEASSQINKLQKTLYLRDSELAAARSANDGLKKKIIELEGMLKATIETCDKKKETAYYYVNDVLQATALYLKHENERLEEKIIELENVIKSCNSRIQKAFDHALGLEKENAYYKQQVDLVNASTKDLIEKLQAKNKYCPAVI